MTANRLRIGSRGSELALWQARWVQSSIQHVVPGMDVTIEVIKTTGDKILDSPLSVIGDKGLFTKEIEQALLEEKIDLAVHSLKDLPTTLPQGLALGAVCKREDVRDVFVPHPSNPVRALLEQPAGARIATGSLRRKCQLLARRPDLAIIDVRGNLTTRFRKLEESDWQGMVLARAGMMRLGLEKHVGEVIDVGVMLPAVGQGALGIEVRVNDTATRDVVVRLNHACTARATAAERALLRTLEGGCQVPIGAYGRIEEDRNELVLDAFVGSLDGRSMVRGSSRGKPEEAEQIGVSLAVKLLSAGAERILDSIRAGKASDGD